MRRALTAVGPALALLVFLLPALLPLLQATALPCSHDNDLHLYRIVALREAARQGWIFARWIPNLALGYGYPFFNFREPLPYLVGEGLALLGIPATLILGLLYAASLLAAAWGAYTLARDLFSSARAGWVAALTYSLGPYLLLDALRRGNMPESVALALLPWLLVVYRRLILEGRRRDFVAAVLLLAALFLSHNISSLLFAPFLGSYVLLLSWFHRDRRAWPWAFVAVALALLLTVWFWFPALTEQETVHLHLSRTTRNNDFHYNFITWRELLLTLPAPYDPAYLNPPMRVPLGILPLSLGLLGAALGLWRLRGEQRALLGLCLALILGYLWMSTPDSQPVWDAFPLLAFVQFPWRLVGRALLPVALLASAAFAVVSVSLPPRAGRGVFYLALASLTVCAWPDTFPPKGMCALPANPTLADVYAFERAGWMGVDPEGSYFPAAVEERPTAMTLADAWLRGEEPQRFDATALPPDARVLSADYHPLRARLEVESPAPFRARWLGFDYPGWQVRVDGVVVATAPEDDTGLLTFELPAGRHRVEVAFGATPRRALVETLSWLTLPLFLGLAIGWRCRRSKDATAQPHLLWQPVLALALALLLARLTAVEWLPNPARHARLTETSVPEVTTAARQAFAGGLTLRGYTLPTAPLPADGEAQVDLLWQATAIPPREYRTAVLLLDGEGRLWSPSGASRPRGYEPTPPTTQWLPGQYAYDPQVVQALPGTPPGSYRLALALFDRETLTPVSVLGADGNPAAPDLTLGTIQVTRPTRPPTVAELGGGAVLTPCGAVGLWGMALDRAAAAPGDVTAVRWVWETLRDPATVITATVRLRDSAGAVRREWALPPVAAWWPTTGWRTGDRWRGEHVVRLPGGLESGRYTLETAVGDCALAAQRELEVQAPTRVWRAPEGLRAADAVWGGLIELVGYAVEPKAHNIQVRLAWRARTEMETPYRVFVHVLGPDGQLVAQSDGDPAGWTRPTTGWASGEVVLDERAVALPADSPAGAYTVRVGWYAVAGPRLALADGADALTVGVVEAAAE